MQTVQTSGRVLQERFDQGWAFQLLQRLSLSSEQEVQGQERPPLLGYRGY